MGSSSSHTLPFGLCVSLPFATDRFRDLGGLKFESHSALRLMCFSRFRHRAFRLLVGSSGFEPPTSRLSGVRSNHLSYEPLCEPYGPGGDERARTDDPLLAKQVLSQLSYTPMRELISLFEMLTAPQKLNNDCKSST